MSLHHHPSALECLDDICSHQTRSPKLYIFYFCELVLGAAAWFQSSYSNKLLLDWPSLCKGFCISLLSTFDYRSHFHKLGHKTREFLNRLLLYKTQLVNVTQFINHLLPLQWWTRWFNPSCLETPQVRNSLTQDINQDVLATCLVHPGAQGIQSMLWQLLTSVY